MDFHAIYGISPPPDQSNPSPAPPPSKIAPKYAVVPPPKPQPPPPIGPGGGEITPMYGVQPPENPLRPPILETPVFTGFQQWFESTLPSWLQKPLKPLFSNFNSAFLRIFPKSAPTGRPNDPPTGGNQPPIYILPPTGQGGNTREAGGQVYYILPPER